MQNEQAKIFLYTSIHEKGGNFRWLFKCELSKIKHRKNICYHDKKIYNAKGACLLLIEFLFIFLFGLYLPKYSICIEKKITKSTRIH